MRRVMLVVLSVLGSGLVGWQLVRSSIEIVDAQSRNETAKQVSSAASYDFPIAIPGTCLIARYPVAYEGGYMEDGSGDYVVDVAAVVLFNTANYGIERASVVLQWEHGSYEFEATMLPPRAGVLVLEKNRQKHEEHSWTNCSGTQQAGENWSHPSNLAIAEYDTTALCVRNTGDEVIKDLRIHYKGYLQEENLYLGGITYTVGLDELNPGDTTVLCPLGYVRDYTKVVRVGCSGIG